MKNKILGIISAIILLPIILEFLQLFIRTDMGPLADSVTLNIWLQPLIVGIYLDVFFAFIIFCTINILKLW